jgi:hypothetical protein
MRRAVSQILEILQRIAEQWPCVGCSSHSIAALLRYGSPRPAKTRVLAASTNRLRNSNILCYAAFVQLRRSDDIFLRHGEQIGHRRDLRA